MMRIPVVVVVVLAAMLPVGSFAESARLMGVVKFSGEVPRRGAPDDGGVYRPLIQVDKESGGLGEVVVYLLPKAEPPEQGKVQPGESSGKRSPVVDQVDHEFIPRVLAVRAGEEVIFTNSDPANHNVRAISIVPGNSFNVYVPFERRYRHRFKADEQQRPVVLDCDIHPWMRGWIFVFDHPWFAVTNGKGEFQIDNIPPGDYLVVLRQPDLPWRETREMSFGPGAEVSLEVEASGTRAKTE
jgi:plastocyanin